MTWVERVTADQLIRMQDDGYRYELVKGELRRLPYNDGEHGAVGGNLGWRLGNYVADTRIGRIFMCAGFHLEQNPDTVLAPDLALIHADRLPPREEWAGYLRVPPDLAVEVASGWERGSDLAEKAGDYLAFGVRAVWVVVPKTQTVTIYESDCHPRVLAVGDTLDGGDVVPGFQMPVAALFR